MADEDQEQHELRHWRNDPMIRRAAIVQKAEQMSRAEQQAVAQIQNGLKAAEEGFRTLVERGWSQARIAAEVGKSQATISRWLAELGIETAGTKRGHGGFRPSLIQDESRPNPGPFVHLPMLGDGRPKRGRARVPAISLGSGPTRGEKWQTKEYGIAMKVRRGELVWSPHAWAKGGYDSVHIRGAPGDFVTPERAAALSEDAPE